MRQGNGLVLVVEGEGLTAELLRRNLVRAGFAVHLATGADAGLAAARTLHPVAIVLDVDLPGSDGTEVCRQLRTDGDRTPVLFMTAYDDQIERVLELGRGADDFVTKPLRPREVVARVRAALQRTTSGTPSEESPLTVGDVTLDRDRRQVIAQGIEVRLTTTEFDLLAHLMRRPGWVFPREKLLEEVWGYTAAGGTRTVDVHVAQLRAKLGRASPIRTVRGVGYGVNG